jgi:hypothetical protein
MAYGDASFAPFLAEGCSRSMTGLVVTIAGAPILWKSSRQTIATSSTAESELTAQIPTAQAGLGVESLLMELGLDAQTISCNDNQASMSIVAGTTQRSRHLMIKAGVLRDTYLQGLADSVYTRTNEQKADLLTKILSIKKHVDAMKMLEMGAVEGLISDTFARDARDTARQGRLTKRWTPRQDPEVSARSLALVSEMSSQSMEVGVRFLSAVANTALQEYIRSSQDNQKAYEPGPVLQPTVSMTVHETTHETTEEDACGFSPLSFLAGALTSTIAHRIYQYFLSQEEVTEREVGVQAPCTYQRGRFVFLGHVSVNNHQETNNPTRTRPRNHDNSRAKKALKWVSEKFRCGKRNTKGEANNDSHYE